jgi:glycosyltransferase involved in cell wall biosynthesis
MPNPRDPKISVIMPTWNRAHLLARAIKSVQQQTLPDWELIVINDASTDGTRALLDDLAKHDPRIRPIHNEKNNYPDISKNLNDGMAAARGRYIARLDDDDYWCDDGKLAMQAEFFDAHPDHVITGGGTIVIDEKDRERFRYFKLETDAQIRDKALFANPFTHSTVMFRRDVAQAVGGYGSYGNVEDWDLWLRMGLRGKFYNFQNYFVRYLLTEKSKTFIFKHSQSRDILRVLGLHRKEYPHFATAYALNYAQYMYSFLPQGAQRALHSSLSRMKRGLFSGA